MPLMKRQYALADTSESVANVHAMGVIAYFTGSQSRARASISTSECSFLRAQNHHPDMSAAYPNAQRVHAVCTASALRFISSSMDPPLFAAPAMQDPDPAQALDVQQHCQAARFEAHLTYSPCEMPGQAGELPSNSFDWRVDCRGYRLRTQSYGCCY